MNYAYQYFKLICRRIEQPLTKDDCYVERHHIIPKSECGTNDAWNLVNLTAREHYIAHLLLAKIYCDYKMLCAVMRMQCNRRGRDFKFNSHLYAKLRKQRAENPVLKEIAMKMNAKLTHEQRVKNGRAGGKKGGKNQPREAKVRGGQNIPHEAHVRAGKKMLGMHWWNNGTVNKRAKECPSEGWVRGQLGNSEGSARGGKKMLGMLHWNNGTVNRRSPECPGPGWVRGQLGDTGKASKGMLYWNDGTRNKRAKECPGEGWVKGQLKKRK